MGFFVTANGVHYSLTELRLNPHETRMVDLRKLRDAQLPDFQGKLTPGLRGQPVLLRHNDHFVLEFDGHQHSHVEQHRSDRPTESVGCGPSVCERAGAGQENRVYFQSSQPQPTSKASMATTSAAIHVAAIAMGGGVACRASHTNALVARATIK
jgi:hypothetical protein